MFSAVNVFTAEKKEIGFQIHTPFNDRRHRRGAGYWNGYDDDSDDEPEFDF
jgi:hypothetical protein